MFRRYLLLGAFDGLTLEISILLSSQAAKLNNRELLIITLASLLAISISSGWNALIIELNEADLALKELERQMLRSLRGTVYDYSFRIAAVLSSLLHAVSPFLGLIPAIVFIYTKDLILAEGVSLIILGVIGFLYGKKIVERIKYSGILLFSGIILVVLIYYISK